MQQTMLSAEENRVGLSPAAACKTHRRQFVFATVLLYGLVGCSGPTVQPYDAGLAVEDESLAQGLRNTMRKTYPQAFRASARCVFTGPQGQFAFSGHVLVCSTGEMRVLALTDFGSVIFEVALSPQSRAAVVRNHSDWSDATLIECALRDVATIYAKQPPGTATIVRHADGSEGLCWRTDNECREELQFDPGTHRLRRYVKVRGDRIIHEVAFSGYVTDTRWGGSVPQDITVSDHKCSYVMVIHVLKLDPMAGSGQVPD